MYTIMVEKIGDSKNFTLFEKGYHGKRCAVDHFKKICFDYWLKAKSLNDFEKSPSIRTKEYGDYEMWEVWINENNTHYPYVVTFMVE